MLEQEVVHATGTKYSPNGFERCPRVYEKAKNMALSAPSSIASFGVFS